MSRMIDVIRSSGASANVMQTAARGALHVPPQEMIEILVYLATQTKIFAERARLTLAGWDEASSLAAHPIRVRRKKCWLTWSLREIFDQHCFPHCSRTPRCLRNGSSNWLLPLRGI